MLFCILLMAATVLPFERSTSIKSHCFNSCFLWLSALCRNAVAGIDWMATRSNPVVILALVRTWLLRTIWTEPAFAGYGTTKPNGASSRISVVSVRLKSTLNGTLATIFGEQHLDEAVESFINSNSQRRTADVFVFELRWVSRFKPSLGLKQSPLATQSTKFRSWIQNGPVQSCELDIYPNRTHLKM
jgi:hypothetical protein